MLRLQGFADELRKWWSFDDRQRHTHSWHSREDFIEKKLPALLSSNRDDRIALADEIIQEIVECYDNARRDEGAFPAGDRRAAMSEHRLWHAMQIARSWRNRLSSFGQSPNDKAAGG